MGERQNRPVKNFADHQTSITESVVMLYTIAMVLLILWLLGLVSGATLGGFIHVLLVIAIVMILIRLISGRKVV
jgi:hypothetical protein